MGKGWHKESKRHSDSAKGIKTGRKAQSQSNMKFSNDDMMYPPKEEKEDFLDHVDIVGSDIIDMTTEQAEKVPEGIASLDPKKDNPKPKSKPKSKSGVDFLNKKVFTERDVLLAKRRLNAGKITYDDIFIGDGTNKQLTPEQSQKGIAWLQNQWKSPSGTERKNNPFREREQAILEDATEIELKDYIDLGRGDFKNYQPVYEVLGNNTSFEYYVSGGEISIIG